ncbi:MAG TPA: iron-containing alcohol dehydrogenase family protein [Clostridia bacterium]|nr:iron-containing alcohol dehydrogenase family protein [Clostridia bacterium]
MQFRFNMPVELIFGTGVIKENTRRFNMGKKALLVTGRSSAKLSGALDDVIYALGQEGIDYCIFDKVENNPTTENVSDGAAFGKAGKADFIVAIGGGSPLDAAKAIAALMTNDMDPEDLVRGVPKNKSLPMIAVPTTSGTGSEVTPYSILTIHSMKTKKNFQSPSSFPIVAFADPAYTRTLSYEITLDTAFDAFTHLMESYLSKRSTPFNDSIAMEGMKAFAKCMDALRNNHIDETVRELLMYASCLGGIAITHTGTTVLHAMGYSLTYFRGYSHGRANAMLIGEYLSFNQKAVPEKIRNIMGILGFEDMEEVEIFFDTGITARPVIAKNDIIMYAKLAMGQGSVAQNPRMVDEEDIIGMYQNKFGGAR